MDEEKAILSHFYRDAWERKPPTREHIKFLERAPRSVGDYPEYEAFIRHLNTNFGTTNVTIERPFSLGLREDGTAGNAAQSDIDSRDVQGKEKEGPDQDSTSDS